MYFSARPHGLAEAGADRDQRRAVRAAVSIAVCGEVAGVFHHVTTNAQPTYRETHASASKPEALFCLTALLGAGLFHAICERCQHSCMSEMPIVRMSPFWSSNRAAI